MSVLDELRVKVGGDIARGTDDIIARAILLAAGKEWTLIDVATRMKSERYPGDPFQTIFLDGEPILELHDIHLGGSTLLSRDPADAVYTMRVTQNYKLLGKAAAAHNAGSSTDRALELRGDHDENGVTDAAAKTEE